MQMNVVGLFAGVGGIELGLEAAGHRTSLICEIEPAARAVLAARFPRLPLHDDIRTLDRLPKDTDLVAGGFPCQDISQAGTTKGIAGKNSGLINEVFRLLAKSDVLPEAKLGDVVRGAVARLDTTDHFDAAAAVRHYFEHWLED